MLGAAQRHYAATTDEEEEMALALALSASLAQGAGHIHTPSAPPASVPSRAVAAPRPPPPHPAAPYPQYPTIPSQPSWTPTQPYPAPTHPHPPHSHHHPPPVSSNSSSSSNGAGRNQQAASTPAASKPPASRHQPNKHTVHRLHDDPSKCAGCGQSVWMAPVKAMDRIWHQGCLVCGLCSEPLAVHGSSQRIAIGKDDRWPYHVDCFKLKFHPQCVVCQTFVPAQPDGRIEYKEQVFWKECYCVSHTNDNTPTCCSCARFQPKDTEFVRLEDGRYVCLICLGTIMTDSNDARPLYEEVLRFFRNMGLPHSSTPPFMLVDGNVLNEYSQREGQDRTGGPVFHVRGLTLATVYRAIPTIVRRAGGNQFGVKTVDTVLPEQGYVSHCDVTAVLVMYGLPRLLTGCIIAHELMHAWLRMKHVADLSPKVEEGLCQLMACVWLDHQANSLTDPNEQRLASYFGYQIREDTSVVYGDGFREAYEAFQQRGLTAIVNDVLRRGRFT